MEEGRGEGREEGGGEGKGGRVGEGEGRKGTRPPFMDPRYAPGMVCSFVVLESYSSLWSVGRVD